jgi:hypothetical protein
MLEQSIRQTYERAEGIFRLAPIFVPRLFSQPGHRLKLHPDDYFALGTQRGAIKERWFSSVIAANNGPLAAPDEGMSYVVPEDDGQSRFLLRDAIEELGAEAIGSELMEKYGTWPMYSKFFDYSVPLFHHVHLTPEKAAMVGRLGKPECYYYPPQLNNYEGTMPLTYFGFSPEVTPEEVKQRLRDFETRDTRITELSRAFRIQLGTGWYTPAGVVHAPGSYLTYEPQWNSDVNSVYENVASGEVYPKSFLDENCPDDKKDDIDYIFSLLDWEKNVDPDYRKHYFRPPIDVDAAPDGCIEKWVVYANDYVGAKELTVMPGQTVVITDDAAYGLILTQGYGKLGGYDCETPTLLRFGQLSCDEFFVTEPAARRGVRITNRSRVEPLVMLKHFGPNHPDMPKARN